MNLLDGVTGTATISDDGVYRYDLVRHWSGSGPLCLWVMLNPSKAGPDTDDPTIRKCQGFAERWGFRGIVVVNLFAYRATDPGELLDRPDPVGPLNDRTIVEWLLLPQVGAVVEAWGAHRYARNRGTVVHNLLRTYRTGLWTLGRTASGAPRHPCRLPYDTKRVPA